MSSNLALRIGVVLSGTMIAEHVLRDRHPFSIGQSTRTTVSIPVTDLPRHLDLLTLVDGGLRVRLPAGADARISVGSELLTRADLDRRGTMAGGETTVLLPAGSRGRVELGEVRVLFQTVTLPAAVAPPRLPRALQGSLADRVDRRLAAFVAASVVAHLGVMAAASLNDPPVDHTLAQRATEQYKDETLAIIDADDPLLNLQPPDEPDAPAEPDPAPAAQTPSKPSPAEPPRTSPRPPSTRPDPGALPEPGRDATRYADLLFSNDGVDGKPATDLSNHKPGTDLAQQLDEIKRSNDNASIGKDPAIATRDRDGARPGTAQDPILPGTTPPTVIAPPKDDERVPPGRIKPIPPKRTPDGPDVDGIIRKISTTYVSSLQRCYKRSLVGDATLAGKIVLTFTVTDRGAVTDASATGVDDDLSKCVEGAMKAWSFTPVVDADGDKTDVDLRLPLQLTPT